MYNAIKFKVLYDETATDITYRFRYKQYQRQLEKQRFPHLINKRHMLVAEERLPEEESISQLLRRIYKPMMLKPAPLQRSLSLPLDVNTEIISSKTRGKFYKLRIPCMHSAH